MQSGEALTLDLSDPVAGAEVLSGVADLDILVNNAGIIRREDSVDYSEADWDDVMDVNLKAVFLMCQTFAKSAIARGAEGRIVNIASLLSFQGGIRVPAYTASKHGVAGLTKLFANEWSAHGINVNAVAPGYIATNNTTALREDPKRSAEILSRIPAGRWGDPSDIAGAVTFLCGAGLSLCHGGCAERRWGLACPINPALAVKGPHPRLGLSTLAPVRFFALSMRFTRTTRWRQKGAIGASLR